MNDTALQYIFINKPHSLSIVALLSIHNKQKVIFQRLRLLSNPLYVYHLYFK